MPIPKDEKLYYKVKDQADRIYKNIVLTHKDILRVIRVWWGVFFLT